MTCGNRLWRARCRCGEGVFCLRSDAIVGVCCHVCQVLLDCTHLVVTCCSASQIVGRGRVRGSNGACTLAAVNRASDLATA
jgi:hypothetical protein